VTAGDDAHKPVLLDEALAALAVRGDGYYVDGTFGRGGHSGAILGRLGPAGHLLAIDQDADAVSSARAQFGDDPRFSVAHASFAELDKVVSARGIGGQVDGVLLDLGVSSPQLDAADRGFSFLRDGPLDMRMDQRQATSAADWIARASEPEISSVLHRFGEERHARRIARAIVAARRESPIRTTRRLAEIVAAANPAWERDKHPATRTFQAIRIQVNQELSAIEQCLPQAVKVLKVGGRLAVITFHSLEDRLVKQFFRDAARGDRFPKGLPVPADRLRPSLRLLGKPVAPSASEVARNPRARSARLRAAERIA
jgi:16S rRNA (cytosine1402-N4)-methyltransferase